MRWESRLLARGGQPLVDPSILRNSQLRAGLTTFFAQYFVQGGLFFAVPLFLSVALGLSAIETGVRLLPLSVTLLIAAAGIPRYFPNASPRRVAELGFLTLFVGLVVLIALLDQGAGAEITTWPMLLAGAGVGALASQLGSVTVSAVPDERSGEVGGLQNTLTNLGISVSTALTGAVLIAALSSSFLTGVQQNPAVPEQVKSQASTKLAGGIPFISDKELEAALEKSGRPPRGHRRDRGRERNGAPARPALRDRDAWRSSPCWRPSSAAACRMSNPRPPKRGPPPKRRPRRRRSRARYQRDVARGGATHGVIGSGGSPSPRDPSARSSR